jgi:hypothetical protein
MKKNKIRYKVLKTYFGPCGLYYVKDTHPTKPYLAMRHYRYFSKRYGKRVTVKFGDRSDGATGAFDIISCGWWVHDKLCEEGTWDDGTPITNWQCSRVLSDILWHEERYVKSVRWLFATFLLGGGKARKNGMFKLTVS